MGGSDNIATPPELAGEAYRSAVLTGAGRLKQKLIDRTLHDGASWTRAMGQAIGADGRPGDGGLGSRGISAEDYRRFVALVENDYSWVVPAFERYLLPDPDATNAMIDALASIEDAFQGSADNTGRFIPAHPGLSRIAATMTDIDRWQGALQENFVDSFLTPLLNVVHNENILAKGCREALLLNKVHYIRYRKAVLNLLDKSMTAVDHTAKDPKPIMWGSLFVDTVGTVLGAGTGAVLAVGTVAGLIGNIVGNLIPEPPTEVDLAAPTAQEVAVNIVDAMGRLREKITEHETHMVKTFNDAHTAISQARASHVAGNTAGPLNVPRPRLDGASKEDILGALRPPG